MLNFSIDAASLVSLTEEEVLSCFGLDVRHVDVDADTIQEIGAIGDWTLLDDSDGVFADTFHVDECIATR